MTHPRDWRKAVIRLDVIVVLLVFGMVLKKWATLSTSLSSMAYILLVPVLFLVLLIDSGTKEASYIREQRPTPRTSSLLLYLAALLLLAGECAQIFTLSMLGFPVAIAAVILERKGWDGLKRSVWALALLFLMIPPPASILFELTHVLTRVSAYVASRGVLLFGGSVDSVGTGLSMGGETIYVTEECSGTGTLMVLLALTLFQAGLCRLSVRKGLLFLALVPLVSLCINTVRILVTMLLLVFVGRPAVSGAWHQVPGIALVIGAMFLTTYLIMKSAREPRGVAA